jgi:hypothetical protein
VCAFQFTPLKSCSTDLISKKQQIEPKSGLDNHLPPSRPASSFSFSFLSEPFPHLIPFDKSSVSNAKTSKMLNTQSLNIDANQICKAPKEIANAVQISSVLHLLIQPEYFPLS